MKSASTLVTHLDSVCVLMDTNYFRTASVGPFLSAVKIILALMAQFATTNLVPTSASVHQKQLAIRTSKAVNQLSVVPMTTIVPTIASATQASNVSHPVIFAVQMPNVQFEITRPFVSVLTEKLANLTTNKLAASLPLQRTHHRKCEQFHLFKIFKSCVSPMVSKFQFNSVATMESFTSRVTRMMQTADDW